LEPRRSRRSASRLDCIAALVEINAWTWTTRPSTDDAEATVFAIAAGELDEHATADWLRQHLASPDSS